MIMHLLNRKCQYKAYKNDKSNFFFKRMLFAKFTQAHAAFGRGWGGGGDLPSPLMAIFYFYMAYRFILYHQT